MREVKRRQGPRGAIGSVVSSAPFSAAWRWLPSRALASVAIYAAGILPSAANMTLVGLSLGALAILARVLFRRSSATAFASILHVLVPLTAASAVIGSMY